MTEYEFWELDFARNKSVQAVCQWLTQAAEFQGWELDRVRKDRTGQRNVRLRRKVIRMHATW
jgi:hypothetical protein